MVSDAPIGPIGAHFDWGQSETSVLLSSTNCLRTFATWGEALSRTRGKPGLHHHQVDNYLTALEVYCSLYQRGCCHPPRICATSHLTDLSVMLNDVTGSITFIRPCPDSFMPVTCARCESAHICKENRVPLTDLQIQVFFRKCQLSCTVLACEQQRTLGLRGLWFWQFSQKHAHYQLMSLLEIIFFMALAVLLLFLLSQIQYLLQQEEEIQGDWLLHEVQHWMLWRCKALCVPLMYK